MEGSDWTAGGLILLYTVYLRNFLRKLYGVLSNHPNLEINPVGEFPQLNPVYGICRGGGREEGEGDPFQLKGNSETSTRSLNKIRFIESNLELGKREKGGKDRQRHGDK